MNKKLLLAFFVTASTYVFPQANTWTSLNLTSAPGSRDSHNMVWDSESQRAIIFGGHGGTTTGTWAYDYSTSTWTSMNPLTDPNSTFLKAEYGMCYVSRHDRVILFSISNTLPAETWEYNYNTNTWTNLNPSVSPVYVQFNTLNRIAYDSESDKVIYVDITTGKVWAYDYLSNLWADMNPPNPMPAIDWRPATIVSYSSNHDRVIVATSFFQQTWAYDYNTNTWQQRSASPNTTLTGGGIYDFDNDSTNDKMIMYGDNQITAGYDYVTDTWSDLAPNPTGPVAHHHAICYMTQYCTMLFYGGIVGDNNNTWKYEYNSCTTGITSEAVENNFTVTVSPNPSSGIFALQSKKEITEIEIYNVMGELVFSSELKTTNYELDLRSKSKGIYFMKVIAEDKISTQKIILD